MQRHYNTRASTSSAGPGGGVGEGMQMEIGDGMDDDALEEKFDEDTYSGDAVDDEDFDEDEEDDEEDMSELETDEGDANDLDKGTSRPLVASAEPGDIFRKERGTTSAFLRPTAEGEAAPGVASTSASNATRPGSGFVPLHQGQQRRVRRGRGLLRRMTVELPSLFQSINSAYMYTSRMNPRRVLTKPAEAVSNGGKDNVNDDLILSVDDVLVASSGRRFLVKEIVGSGTFGQVARCEVAGEGVSVAVKIVKNKTAFYHQARVEVGILHLLKENDPNDEHNLIHMYDYFVHHKHLCIVMELLHINLYELLRQNHFRGLSLNLIRVFSKQILEAMSVLRKTDVIHCDIKPENILLKSPETGDVKLIDFGSACLENRTVYSYIQSRFYRSPEVLIGLQYTSAIDMWSLGCVAAELFLGLPLFPVSSEHDLISRIRETIGDFSPQLLSHGRNTSKYFAVNVVQEGQDAPSSSSSAARNNPSNAYSSSSGGTDIGAIRYTYRLLAVEEMEAKGLKCAVGKRYFTHSRLEDIIMNYGVKRDESKNIQDLMTSGVDRKMRMCFLDFIGGLLRVDPKERWTPYQASKHPFITQEPFEEPFTPPLDPTASSKTHKTFVPSSEIMNIHTSLSPEMAAAVHAASVSPQQRQLQRHMAAHMSPAAMQNPGLVQLYSRNHQQQHHHRGAGLDEGAFTAPHAGMGARAYGFMSPEQFHLNAAVAEASTSNTSVGSPGYFHMLRHAQQQTQIQQQQEHAAMAAAVANGIDPAAAIAMMPRRSSWGGGATGGVHHASSLNLNAPGIGSVPLTHAIGTSPHHFNPQFSSPQTSQATMHAASHAAAQQQLASTILQEQQRQQQQQQQMLLLQQQQLQAHEEERQLFLHAQGQVAAASRKQTLVVGSSNVQRGFVANPQQQKGFFPVQQQQQQHQHDNTGDEHPEDMNME